MPWWTENGNFGLFFTLYHPSLPHLPRNLENHNFLKMTKMLEISSFYMCPKITIIWYGVEPTEFLVILGHFLSFSPPINPENQNFGKMKNAPDVNILHMHTPKTTFIWCMLPEIQGVTHRILCQFGPYFALFFLKCLHKK